MKNHSKSKLNQTLALAGAMQAASLICDIANTGTAEPQALSACINSIFVQEPKSFREIFPHLDHLSAGLTIVRCFFSPDEDTSQVTREYLIGLFHLERKYRYQKSLSTHLGQEIADISEMRSRATESEIIEALGALYVETFGKLKFRIQIKGEQQYLENDTNMSLIRALLLAGVRAAVLWRQSGGHNYDFIISRRQFVACSEFLLADLSA